jgi:hypothetical protein
LIHTVENPNLTNIARTVVYTGFGIVGLATAESSYSTVEELTEQLPPMSVEDN